MSEQKTVNTSIAEWDQFEDHKYGSGKEVHRILSSIPLFSNLSRNNWNELSNLFHTRQYKKDELIFEIGTPGLGMYIVIDGQIGILGERDGKEFEYSNLEQGDFFGEMSLIDDSPRSATAVAKNDVKLIGIFRPQLKKLIHNRPKLGVILLERLASIVVQRLREANKYWYKDQDLPSSEEK